MTVQISNTSTHLVIDTDGVVRNINKQLVREISILRNTIVKVDIGGGALRNIFIPIQNIVAPDFIDNKNLLDKLNGLLTPPEIAITDNLNNLSNTINDIENKVTNMLPASMQEPMFVDESNPNLIYAGFASMGARPDEPSWAIMRTTIKDDVIINQWSNGVQAMNVVWDNRTELMYA